MPGYNVSVHEAAQLPPPATRRRRVTEVQPELPTAKVPDAVAVAPPVPPPTYNVIPQDMPSAGVPQQVTDAITAAQQAGLLGGAGDGAAMGGQQAALPPPTLAQPEEADDPATAGLKRAADKLRSAQDAPIEKNSRLKSFLKMAAYALGKSRPGKDWSDVAMQAGQALGGGIGGAIQPDAPGIIKKEYNVQKAEDELTTAEKLANTVSLTSRRADQTRLGELTLVQRSKAADLNAKYKDYLMREGKRRGDSIIERQKFLTQHAKDVFADKVTQEAWVRDYGERKLGENIRQFNSKDEIARAQLVVNQKRAASYEQSVKNGLLGKQAELAADAAEGQALLDAADEYDTMIQAADPNDPNYDYDEIVALKRAKITALKQGKAKLAGAQAGAAVRGTTVGPPDKTPTMPMKTAKPKKDPLGLFQ